MNDAETNSCVDFRASPRRCVPLVTDDVANQLNVVGWVRNLPDGRVEVMAEAEENKLGEFIEFLKKGPRHAVVETFKLSG